LFEAFHLRLKLPVVGQPTSVATPPRLDST